MKNLGLIFVLACFFAHASAAQEVLVRPTLLEDAELMSQDETDTPAHSIDEVEAAAQDAAAVVATPEQMPVEEVAAINPDDSRFNEEGDALEALKAQDEAVAPDIKLKDNLTETLKENAPEKETSPASETWLGKLKDTGKKVVAGSEESLESMVSRSKKDKLKKSNAAVFDISGVMLRMSLPQVVRTLENRGFRKTMEHMEIPNFIKWRNEELCRNQGVVGYERLGNCVIKLAKSGNHQYVETIKFDKFDTKEEVEVRFTSNFTNNKAYKITYKSMAPNITGNSPQALYTRNIKIYDFWKVVNQKYGKPDNTQDVMWGLGDNKPYLKADTGYLLLEDPMLRELDFTRMSREDQRYMNTNLYSF